MNSLVASCTSHHPSAGKHFPGSGVSGAGAELGIDGEESDLPGSEALDVSVNEVQFLGGGQGQEPVAVGQDNDDLSF